MKKAIRRINAFIKSFILFLRPGILFNFLSTPLLFFSNLFRLTKWISTQHTKGKLNDFYTPGRDYAKRYRLYEYVLTEEKLENTALDYLEFGVSTGESFRWWVSANKNAESKFYGFDTFEGLPEAWGTYSAGDMSAKVPRIEDSRYEFVKGLFQETLFGFLSSHNLNNGKRKVIMLDADLFSSTLFVLTSLAQYLRPNDIIIFDEFNVPNHEFFAFRIFSETFYKKFELIGAQNNYYEVAFRIVT